MGGSRNGWIYVVTAEKTVAPATDVSDVILHKSTNGGLNWTSSESNQDAAGNGKYQYMPAVRVDEYGGVNINYYDTRNIPTNDSAQIYVSRSVDRGSTWSEILVSDHKFMPKPISGLATGYQGDYMGITSGNGKIWPYWADDIREAYQAWIASIDIGPAIAHTALTNTEQLWVVLPFNCVITPSGSGINPSRTKLFWSRNRSGDNRQFAYDKHKRNKLDSKHSCQRVTGSLQILYFNNRQFKQKCNCSIRSSFSSEFFCCFNR